MANVLRRRALWLLRLCGLAPNQVESAAIKRHQHGYKSIHVSHKGAVSVDASEVTQDLHHRGLYAKARCIVHRKSA